METIKKKMYTPRVWQILITVVLVLMIIALFVPGIHYSNLGEIGYNSFSGNYTYKAGRSATYSFHDANATTTIIPTGLTVIAMIGGIVSIWKDRPKSTLAWASIYVIDEIIYIVSVTNNHNIFYDFVSPGTGFFVFTVLTIMLVVFCVIAIKQTKEGERTSKNRVIVSQTVSLPSEADELKKFKQLLDDGVLTQEEFDEKKRQLLSR